MNSKKQGLPGAMSYSASAAFSQNKSLIGAVEREGSCFFHNLYGDFSCQCNQYHRTLSKFYRGIWLNGADVIPFHLFDVEGDMAAFLGDGKTAARIVNSGKFYDFYSAHIYKNGG